MAMRVVIFFIAGNPFLVSRLLGRHFMGASRVRRSHTYLTGATSRAFVECDDMPEPWCEPPTGGDETAMRGAGCPLSGSADFQKVGRKHEVSVGKGAGAHLFCFIDRRTDSALTRNSSLRRSSSGLFGAKRTPKPISSAL